MKLNKFIMKLQHIAHEGYALHDVKIKTRNKEFDSDVKIIVDNDNNIIELLIDEVI